MRSRVPAFIVTLAGAAAMFGVPSAGFAQSASPGGTAPAGAVSAGPTGPLQPVIAADRPELAALREPLPPIGYMKGDGAPVGRLVVDSGGAAFGTVAAVLVDPTETYVASALVSSPQLGEGMVIALPAARLQDRGSSIAVDLSGETLAAAPRYRRQDLERFYPAGATAILQPQRAPLYQPLQPQPVQQPVVTTAAVPAYLLPGQAAGTGAALSGSTGTAGAASTAGFGATAPAGLAQQGDLGRSGGPVTTAKLGEFEGNFYSGTRGMQDLVPTGIAVLAQKGDLIGRQVLDAGRQPFGTIDRLLVTPATGEPRYAIISSPDLGGDSVVVVPVTRLMTTTGNEVQIMATTATLQQAPRYRLSDLQTRFGGN